MVQCSTVTVNPSLMQSLENLVCFSLTPPQEQIQETFTLGNFRDWFRTRADIERNGLGCLKVLKVLKASLGQVCQVPRKLPSKGSDSIGRISDSMYEIMNTVFWCFSNAWDAYVECMCYSVNILNVYCIFKSWCLVCNSNTKANAGFSILSWFRYQLLIFNPWIKANVVPSLFKAASYMVCLVIIYLVVESRYRGLR